MLFLSCCDVSVLLSVTQEETELHIVGMLKLLKYRISVAIRQSFFFLPKHFRNSRSVLNDRSKSLGLFRIGKTYIIAKFHGTDLAICSHFREENPIV